VRARVGRLVAMAGIAGALWAGSTSGAWAQDAGGGRPVRFLDIWALPRVWIGALFCVAGLVLLGRFLVRRRVRLAAVSAAFLVFAVVSALPLGALSRGMGIHPSPVCTVTRPFQFLAAGRGVPVVFIALLAFVALFSILGNKLFCGWVCPIGALQEAFHRLPIAGARTVKLPFRLTNAVRALLFVAFLIVVFTTGVSLYDYFNPFEFLHWGFDVVAVVALAAVLVAAIFMFRPFCYLACPLGLFTWLLEHVSLIRVKLDKPRCNNCNTCALLSPCPAVPAILARRKSRPDCHACGRCIEVCPEKALGFRL
jgi:ferredoxin-type protein NapH